MPTYADCCGWVISIIAGRFEVIADTSRLLNRNELGAKGALRWPILEKVVNKGRPQRVC